MAQAAQAPQKSDGKAVFLCVCECARARSSGCVRACVRARARACVRESVEHRTLLAAVSISRLGILKATYNIYYIILYIYIYIYI